ncbi:hypothetical protein [Methanocalculus sp.]|uniref:hypothetical protein n=1 Tax=Methanocalculus sp. TaxID=2004547 RepID=UPI002635403B|nr:hypothetical protein [Methanocalculus sp.]MDG6251405.1 hypothetical protein [Methanocalculus sp.]
MTGADTASEPVHFLLLGNAKEHIFRAIEYFGIQKVVLFTSQHLMSENQPFIEQLEREGISVLETVFLDPFEHVALERMTQRMLEAYDLHSNGGAHRVIAGLTGGTNLMVLAMGMMCLAAGLKSHYVVHNETNDLIEIDFFSNLAQNMDLSEIQRSILPGAFR